MNAGITVPSVRLQIKDARCLICALLSAREKEPQRILETVATAVASQGGYVVGRALQRRGVSRSKSPGGAGRMDQPLSQRTLFSSGKVEELAAQVRSSRADHLIVFNSLTHRQRVTLAQLTDCRVLSFQDDFAPHPCADPGGLER